MRHVALLSLILPLALGGCPSTNTSPEAAVTTASANTVASAEVALTGADRLALLYVTLPACGSAGATAVCSDPTVKARIKADAQTAYNLVQQAKADATQLAAATAAIAALSADVPPSAAAAAQ